jgi:hypothetical protein
MEGGHTFTIGLVSAGKRNVPILGRGTHLWYRFFRLCLRNDRYVVSFAMSAEFVCEAAESCNDKQGREYNETKI